MSKRQPPKHSLRDIMPGLDGMILKALAFDEIAAYVRTVSEKAQQPPRPLTAPAKPVRTQKAGSRKLRKTR